MTIEDVLYRNRLFLQGKMLMTDERLTSTSRVERIIYGKSEMGNVIHWIGGDDDKE